MAKLIPRQAVLRMAPYSPPTSGRAGKLRLDFNENTVGSSPAVVEFLKQRLSEEGLAVYPEYNEARAEIAAFLNVAPEQLVLTNGTDEAIQLLVNTYVDSGAGVLLLKPSYAMYRFYAELAGASVVEIPYTGDNLDFPVDEFLGAIGGGVRAVMIANPNNPTGSAVGLETVEKVLERASGAAVLIDEAYFEFFGVTALGLLGKHPNLFVSRTFSKVYGMAALRLGCLISAAENCAYLRKAQSPYSVNALAALAARAAIRDGEYITRYAAEVREARAMIYAGFERLGIPYVPSQANFVLFRAGARAIEIRDKLREKNILVRDRSYELPGCVRITVGTREHAQRFLDELEKIW